MVEKFTESENAKCMKKTITIKMYLKNVAFWEMPDAYITFYNKFI